MTRLKEQERKINQINVEEEICLHPLILKLEVNKEELTAFLNDRRKISIPIDWFKKWGHKNIKPKQLKNYELDKRGDYWVYFPDVDIDLGVEVFTDGLKGICPNCH